jgi:hypothetical protein
MISKIENIICLGEGVTPEEIHVKSRKGDVKETRQIIMYFTKELNPNMTWEKIAGYFELDHATGIHAQKTINNLINTNKTFNEKIKKHRIRLKAIKIDRMTDHASGIFKPLEFEVLKLEKKVIDLRRLITEIRSELGEINYQSQCFEKSEKKNIEPVRFEHQFKMPYSEVLPCNNQGYSGFREHSL